MTDLDAAIEAAFDTESMSLREQWDLGILSAEDYVAELADAAHERAKYADLGDW